MIENLKQIFIFLSPPPTMQGTCVPRYTALKLAEQVKQLPGKRQETQMNTNVVSLIWNQWNNWSVYADFLLFSYYKWYKSSLYKDVLQFH